MTPQEAILATVAAWGGRNPAALMAIAKRESAFVATARGDKEAAPRAYLRVVDTLRKMGNPWADDPSRWDASFGLYQMMPAYYARLWDPKADPHVLFDPRIATVVAARLWNKAVAAGATDFVRVRLYWANPSLINVGETSDEYQRRLDKYSIVDGQMNPPVSRFDYSSFGVGPQPGQEERLPRTQIDDPGEMPPWIRFASIALLAYRLWRAYR